MATSAVPEPRGLQPDLALVIARANSVLRSGDLSVHAADDQIGDADVVAHHVPDRIVAPTLVDDLDRLELQSLGIGVDRIDDAAAPRSMRANVEMVRRGDREADQIAAVEDRHAERHVGAVRGAAIIGHRNIQHTVRYTELSPRASRTSGATDAVGTRAEGLQDSFWAAVLTWRWRKSTSADRAGEVDPVPSRVLLFCHGHTR